MGLAQVKNSAPRPAHQGAAPAQNNGGQVAGRRAEENRDGAHVPRQTAGGAIPARRGLGLFRCFINPFPRNSRQEPNPALSETRVATPPAPQKADPKRTPLFQEAIKQATLNAQATADNIKNNSVASVKLSPAVLEELSNVFKTGDKKLTIYDNFNTVDLMNDASFKKDITDYANALHKNMRGESKTNLVPSALEIREQAKATSGATRLHQDGNLYTYTMTIALGDAEPTQWVPKEHLGDVEMGSIGFVLTEQAKNNGKTLDGIMKTSPPKHMNILTGDNKYLAEDQDGTPHAKDGKIPAAIHRAPQADKRTLVLLRFSEEKPKKGDATA